MSITHSRAIAAAVVALSTCAGATQLARRAPDRAAERVAARVAQADAPAARADTATIVPETPGAAH